MDQYLDITRALGDETRVRALLGLAGGELCVCQIIELLGLSPSTVSKHMSILQRAGLVERRKDGRWHYYRLAGEDAPPLARQALQWTLNAMRNEKIIVADAQAICCVRAKDREELTACYNAS
jgi:arsenate reductase/ArsR family transcriptional regulator